MSEAAGSVEVRVEGLTMAYGSKLVQSDLTFEVRDAEVFAIVGASGCGKSTLLRHMIGLQPPAAGRVRYGEDDINSDDEAVQKRLRRRFGVAFQSGALWSSMSVGENVMLPLELRAEIPHREIASRARA